MKVLCGIYPHGSYEGEIVFAGEVIQATHIRDTERKGIAITSRSCAGEATSPWLRTFFWGPKFHVMAYWITTP